MLLSDREIRYLATQHNMIAPFLPELIRTSESGHRMLSAGPSSFGYDLRAAPLFKIFVGARSSSSFNYENTIVDPKDINEGHWHTLPVLTGSNGDFVVIPPQTFALCHSVETVTLPPDVTALVAMKSTYARAGLICYTTVGEAGWRGVYVLEIFNTLTAPIKVYVNEGIAQLLFLSGIERAEVSYADRNGKYQNQTGITHAKV